MLSITQYPLIWLIVFGAGLTVLFIFSQLLTSAAHTLSDNEKRSASRIGFALILWPIIAIAYALSIGLNFTKFIPMLAIPLFLTMLIIFKDSASRILENISLHLLILLGTYRVAGAIFLHSYYQHDILSYGFAFNAGWGDILTGVLAPLVAVMVYTRSPWAFTAVLIWTFVGIGDLILAPISAGIYGAERLVDFPLNLIPLFLGPPFGIVLHVITLRATWLQREKLSQTNSSRTTL